MPKGSWNLFQAFLTRYSLRVMGSCMALILMVIHGFYPALPFVFATALMLQGGVLLHVLWRKRGPSAQFLRQEMRDHPNLSKFYDSLLQQESFLKDFDAREIFDLSPAGVVFLDEDGLVKVMNRTFQDMFMGDVPVAVEEPFEDLLDGSSAVHFQEQFAAFLKGSLKSRTLEFRLKHTPDRQVIAYVGELTHHFSPRDEGAPRAVALYLFDHTDQKRLQNQLIQAQRLRSLSQMAGGIAHDFNNLLTAMMGFCDLILSQKNMQEGVAAHVLQIQQNAQRAAALVSQLLAFSSQQTLQPRALSLTPLLEQMSLLLQRLVGPQIRLRLLHGRHLSPVLADKNYLEQILLNLVVNAREAIQNEGEIIVRTANKTFEGPLMIKGDLLQAGDYVLLEISDTGRGMSKETLEHVFDPFFSTKEGDPSVGLGLASVYGIVRQLGGYIFVDSEVHRGTKLTLYLPQASESELALSAANDRALLDVAPAKKGKVTGRLLLVEDEEAVRLFAAKALRHRGYEVVEAGNGEEGLAQARAGAFDLIVTDVMMPEMDGPTMVQVLLKEQPEARVLFISGYAEDMFRQQLHDQPNLHFLPKPFAMKDLLRRVGDLLPGDGLTAVKTATQRVS